MQEDITIPGLVVISVAQLPSQASAQCEAIVCSVGVCWGMTQDALLPGRQLAGPMGLFKQFLFHEKSSQKCSRGYGHGKDRLPCSQSGWLLLEAPCLICLSIGSQGGFFYVSGGSVSVKSAPRYILVFMGTGQCGWYCTYTVFWLVLCEARVI